ncbi:hypothetical protein [Thermocatellispora tengchongensis]|uniref:hypothetical protein n=1 Tax=Thermocatellispora tengchongensis TaxID=1073253 RepID=UPI00362910B6
MTLKEKVALLTGADAWTLTPVPSAGLGALALSDGPVGPRGTSYGGDTTPRCCSPAPPRSPRPGTRRPPARRGG